MVAGRLADCCPISPGVNKPRSRRPAVPKYRPTCPSRQPLRSGTSPRSLSTLYETELVFPPYYATELYEILKKHI